MTPSDDFLRIVLHDEYVDPDARFNLLQIFPNMIFLKIENSKTDFETEITGNESVENKSVMELFADFYQMSTGNQPDDKTEALFKNISEKAMQEDL